MLQKLEAPSYGVTILVGTTVLGRAALAVSAMFKIQIFERAFALHASCCAFFSGGSIVLLNSYEFGSVQIIVFRIILMDSKRGQLENTVAQPCSAMHYPTS